MGAGGISEPMPGRVEVRPPQVPTAQVIVLVEGASDAAVVRVLCRSRGLVESATTYQVPALSTRPSGLRRRVTVLAGRR